MIEELAKLLTEDIRVNNGLVLESNFTQMTALAILRRPDVMRWLRAQGVDPHKLAQIGEGGVGRVFAFGDKAIKLTVDKNEYEMSQQSAKTCNGHPSIVNIYDTLAVPETYKDRIGRSREFYLIASDRVDTDVPDSMRVAANIVGSYTDDNPPPFDMATAFKEIMTDPKYAKDAFATGDFSEYEGGTENKREVRKQVQQLLRVLLSIHKKCDLSYVDVGATNVGLRDGQPVLFDLGLSTFAPAMA